MKKILFYSLSLVLIVGCDTPQRTRVQQTFSGNGLQQPTTSGSGSGLVSGTTSGTTTGGTTTPGTSLGAGFENCDISNKYHTVDLGHFGLCQSSQAETTFKVRFSLESSQIRNCLIPTYKDAAGNSTYIGQPQCTYVQSASVNQVVNGMLYKNRPGFESFPLNGVIVMKEPLLPEYIRCMHGYINWLPQACANGPGTSSYCNYWIPRCPNGAQSNAMCDQEARNYMSNICTSFKTKYQNSYLDIRTK
jgi:hypothetical protein